jgi:C4-type Zn-finger protein
MTETLFCPICDEMNEVDQYYIDVDTRDEVVEVTVKHICSQCSADWSKLKGNAWDEDEHMRDFLYAYFEA